MYSFTWVEEENSDFKLKLDFRGAKLGFCHKDTSSKSEENKSIKETCKDQSFVGIIKKQLSYKRGMYWQNTSIKNKKISTKLDRWLLVT